MSATLDPIWTSYQRATDAFRIVRRVVLHPSLASHASAPLRSTGFDGLALTAVDALIDTAQEQFDDQTVLSLYAAFESALRDHLIAQSAYLKTHATNPDVDFAAGLAEQYESWCEEARMDKVAGLFVSAAGVTLVAQVGQIRVYRHWLAHGKRWAKPPQTNPGFAYKTLDGFLSKICASLRAA